MIETTEHFRVTITRTGLKHYTDRDYKKIADSGNEKDGGAVYGYVEYPASEQEETKGYEQEMQSLDLAAVIKAVNKI